MGHIKIKIGNGHVVGSKGFARHVFQSTHRYLEGFVALHLDAVEFFSDDLFGRRHAGPTTRHGDQFPERAVGTQMSGENTAISLAGTDDSCTGPVTEQYA